MDAGIPWHLCLNYDCQDRQILTQKQTCKNVAAQNSIFVGNVFMRKTCVNKYEHKTFEDSRCGRSKVVKVR